MTTSRHIVAGIDPGVQTGYAKWDAAEQRMVAVETSQIHRVLHDLREGWQAGWLSYVVFEDARLRTFFGTVRGSAADDARKQGAGSIKRDCTILADFCEDMGIPCLALSPQQKGSKVSPETFTRLAKWEKRTSNHGRDAGMLVLGRAVAVPSVLATKAKAKRAKR